MWNLWWSHSWKIAQFSFYKVLFDVDTSLPQSRKYWKWLFFWRKVLKTEDRGKNVYLEAGQWTCWSLKKNISVLRSALAPLPSAMTPVYPSHFLSVWAKVSLHDCSSVFVNALLCLCPSSSKRFWCCCLSQTHENAPSGTHTHCDR